MAIIKVSLDPANEDDLESWQDKLKEVENKKTFLYLLVDAHSNNADKEVIYHGCNPETNGKPDKTLSKTIAWIWKASDFNSSYLADVKLNLEKNNSKLLLLIFLTLI